MEIVITWRNLKPQKDLPSNRHRPTTTKKNNILILNKCCISTYIYKYMRNIIKHNIRTSVNEWIHFFIKNISLTLYSWKGDVGCVWEMSWRRGQAAILTQFFWPLQHFFRLILAGVAQPWVTDGPKPSVCRWLSLQQLNRTAPGTWLYHCLTYTCFCCSSTYLHRCISWLTAWSRVNI